MTESQAKALCKILRELGTFNIGGNCEIKEYEVEDYKQFISVVAEVGMVGDEGTLASLLCRYRVHLFVGKRGGITYSATSRNGKRVTRQLSQTTMFSVALEQRK